MYVYMNVYMCLYMYISMHVCICCGIRPNALVLTPNPQTKDGFEKMFGKDSKEFQEVDTMFRRLDLDGSGKLDYTEFCAAGIGERMSTEEHVLWAAFKAFDVQDDDGRITKEEIKQVLLKAGVDKFWTTQVCEELSDELFSRYDKNGDGSLDFQEFAKLMREIAKKHTCADGATHQADLIAHLETGTKACKRLTSLISAIPSQHSHQHLDSGWPSWSLATHRRRPQRAGGGHSTPPPLHLSRSATRDGRREHMARNAPVARPHTCRHPPPPSTPSRCGGAGSATPAPHTLSGHRPGVRAPPWSWPTSSGSCQHGLGDAPPRRCTMIRQRGRCLEPPLAIDCLADALCKRRQESSGAIGTSSVEPAT